MATNIFRLFGQTKDASRVIGQIHGRHIGVKVFTNGPRRRVILGDLHQITQGQACLFKRLTPGCIFRGFARINTPGNRL